MFTDKSQVLCSYDRLIFDKKWPTMLVTPNHLTHATALRTSIHGLF